MTPENLIEKVARAICAEQCAFYGEPPCFESQFTDEADDIGLSPHCDSPGCKALAMAAITANNKEIATIIEQKHGYGVTKQIAEEIRDMIPGKQS